MKKDLRVEAYVNTLNQLHQDTNTLINCEVKILEVNQPQNPNAVIGIIKWDSQKNEYYYVLINNE